MDECAGSELRLRQELDRMRRRVAELERLVAAHQETKQALTVSEARWRAICESSPDHIMTVGLDGTVHYINHVLPESEPESVVGRKVYDFVSQDQWPTMRECFQRVVQTGQVDRYEVDFDHVDGTRIRFEARVGPIVQDARVVAFAVVCTDVTETRRIEQELRWAREELEQRVAERTAELQQANEQLSGLLDNLPDFVMTVDRDATIEFLNRVGAGVSIDRFLGRSFIDFARREDRDRIREHLAEAFRSDQIQRFEAADFRGACYAVRVVPLGKAGEGRRAMVIATDITDAKQYEELSRIQRDLCAALNQVSGLREAARLCMDTALGVSPMDCAGVFLRDDIGNLDLVAYRGISEAFAKRLLHISADSRLMELDAGAQPIYLHVDDVPAEDRDEFLQEGLRSLAAIPILHEEREIACLATASHTLRDIPNSARLTLEAIGAAVGGGMARITTQKQAEQELFAKQELLHKILNVQEQERELVTFEIHDGFVQYVNAAIMHLEACRARQQAGDRTAAEQQLDKVFELLRRSVAEARRVMNGLRPPILNEYGVVAAVEHLICDLRRSGDREIRFDHDIRFDRLASPLENAIFRVVQEALANACRHSQSQRIAVHLDQDDACIRVCVEDWGVGFDPESVPADRFGLRGIRERARLFEGQARIESRAGRGTRVVVDFPVVPTAATG